MARNDEISETSRILLVISFLVALYYYKNVRPRLLGKRKRSRKYSILDKVVEQKAFLKRLTGLTDRNCHSILRMDRTTFTKFCNLLIIHGKLEDSKFVDVEEKVAAFLFIIGHHVKNRVVAFAFDRSGDTISIRFHEVLAAVLRCHDVLLATPEPVPNDNDDFTWKHFKGCLGALDGTHIPMTIKKEDQPRYRNRKGHVSVNMLGVCDRELRFVYVLTGWEGSAADARVLRDAMTRPNGLRISQGSYYLVDCGYSNAPGCLAPFRSVRYHLQEFGNGCLIPQNAREYFNMKHSGARSCIERTFGILKKRFAILRSPSFYPVDVQNNIILACCLVHNFCRSNMARDLVEDESSDDESSDDDSEDEESEDPPALDYIDNINTTTAWTNMRDDLANIMFNEWRGTRARRGNN